MSDYLREEGILKGKEEGMLAGREEIKLEIAKNLLSMNMDLEAIQKATGLSKSNIKSIASKK